MTFLPQNITLDFWFYTLVCVGVMWLIQMFYFFNFFLRLARYKEKNMGLHDGKPVSVIIAARNELDNLKQNLPLILEQDYAKFQVIVVNDRSWDASADYLRAMEKQYAHLHIITIQESELYQHGKKMAITLGVKGAKYDYLLFTDADCEPSSKHWISEMLKGYDSNEIVLGFSPYQKKKGILNWLIRFDAVQIGMQYLSFALAGVPYMGVGRNLSYKKNLFFENNGFKNHYHVKSGDDDLFVNETASKSNVRIRLNNQAFMASHPKENLTDWWWQKKRHFSTSGLYKWHHKFLLSLYPISLLLLLVSTVMLVFKPWIWVVLSLFSARIIIQLLIFRKVYKKLGASELLILTPILELIFLFVNPMIHVSNAFVKPTKWA